MMERWNLNFEFDLRQRILNSLILRTPFLEDLGIMEGKMGVLLVLVEYCKLYPNDVYEDYINELIDDIWRNVHVELPFDFSKGICGIGWGIEALIYNDIIEGSGVELCAEVDCKIMQTDPRRICNMSLENGLEGLLRYILVHIGNAQRQGSPLPFDEVYRQDLFYTIQSMDQDKIKYNRIQCFADQYKEFYSLGKIPHLLFDLNEFVDDVKLDEVNLNNIPLGLNKGLAGILLKDITSTFKRVSN